MVFESVHVSTTIDRPADEVYAYAVQIQEICPVGRPDWLARRCK